MQLQDQLNGTSTRVTVDHSSWKQNFIITSEFIQLYKASNIARHQHNCTEYFLDFVHTLPLTMKKLLLFLSFLLFNSFLSFAAEELYPVLDINGEEIRPGVEYHGVSAIFGGGGGGLTCGKGPDNEICPLAVVQALSDLNRGHPVTFTPVNPEEGVIRVSTDLNIKFSPFINFCRGSNVWKVHFNEALEQHFVLTDGVEGNSGCETTANWFKIEAVGVQGYKLVFCPTVCDSSSEAICKYVGIYHNDDGTRRLALGGQPYPVVFIKKNEDILKSVTST